MGLDQYLYRCSKKLKNKKELNRFEDFCALLENPLNFIHYEEIKKGNPYNFLKYGFISSYQEKVLEQEKLFSLYKNRKKGLRKEKCKDYLKFIGVYIPEFLSDMEKAISIVKNNEEYKYHSDNIGYWRKHADLQGYMSDLYYNRDGTGDFNCKKLILSKEDCENVITWSQEQISLILNQQDVEHTTGFFFGSTDLSDHQKTIEIFSKVLEETDFENETIYYDSWW